MLKNIKRCVYILFAVLIFFVCGGMNKKPLPGDGSVTIAVTGDIMLDSGVKRLIDAGGYAAVISKDVTNELTRADFVFANLEMPFSTRGTAALDKQYTFKGNPADAALLVQNNIKIVTLANNHSLDYGKDALADTFAALDENAVRYVGAGNNLSEAEAYKIITVNGKTFAFLAASRVIPEASWYATKTAAGLFGTYDGTELAKQIAEAKQRADFVIVYVHWGIERNTTPENYQRSLAEQYIVAGADVVIGSHPHVLQGFEYYKGKLIAYSMGNFIFTDDAKDTMILDLTFDKRNISASVVPCRIVNLKTELVTGDKARSAFDYLEGISFGVKVDGQGRLSEVNASSNVVNQKLNFYYCAY